MTIYSILTFDGWCRRYCGDFERGGVNDGGWKGQAGAVVVREQGLMVAGWLMGEGGGLKVHSA